MRCRRKLCKLGCCACHSANCPFTRDGWNLTTHLPLPTPRLTASLSHLDQVGGQAAAAVGVKVGQRGGDARHRDAGTHSQLHHAAPCGLPAGQRRTTDGGRVVRGGAGMHRFMPRGGTCVLVTAATQGGFGAAHERCHRLASHHWPSPATAPRCLTHRWPSSCAKSGSTSRLGSSGLRWYACLMRSRKPGGEGRGGGGGD